MRSGRKYAPDCGALWGAYTLQGRNPEQAVTGLESQIGRKFDLTKRYHDFSDSRHQGRFPDAFERKLGQSRTPFIAWQARVSKTKRNISWRAIANGSYDRYVKSAATRVKAYKRPMFIAFDPAFDAHRTKGSMADYVAAYRHIVQVFKANKVTNVAWAWVSTGYVGGGNGSRIQQGYPGDAYVDWIGWDTYNFYKCNGSSWKTFAQKVTPTYNWMQANGHGDKPFLLSGYGTQYDRANAARSTRGGTPTIPGALKNLPNLKAMIRSDSNGASRTRKCNFYIKNGGAASLKDFANAGRAVQAGLQPGSSKTGTPAQGGSAPSAPAPSTPAPSAPKTSTAPKTPTAPSTPVAPRTTGASGSATCGAVGKYAPKCGALWGAYTLQGGNPETAVTNLESQVGRKFDLTLRYHDFSDHQHQGQFPDAYERRLGQSRYLFFSWQARVSDTNRNISWRAIANGSYDRYIKSAATRVKAYNRPVFIAFDPEFDTHKTKGSMADYVAAYRHVFNVFKSYQVTNVAWAWVSSGYLGAGNSDRIQQAYPGDAYVDWVGWDPYNFYRCNGTAWKTFGEKVTPTYNWMKANGHGDKPFLLSEYGTQFDSSNPSRSAQWHAGIPGALKNLPNLKAMVRFDADGFFGSKKCNLYIKNGGNASLQDFAKAGREVQAGLRR